MSDVRGGATGEAIDRVGYLPEHVEVDILIIDVATGRSVYDEVTSTARIPEGVRNCGLAVGSIQSPYAIATSRLYIDVESGKILRSAPLREDPIASSSPTSRSNTNAHPRGWAFLFGAKGPYRYFRCLLTSAVISNIET